MKKALSLLLGAALALSLTGCGPTVPEIQADDIMLTTLDKTHDIEYLLLPESCADHEVTLEIVGNCVSLEGHTLTVLQPGLSTLTIMCDRTEKAVDVNVKKALEELIPEEPSLELAAGENSEIRIKIGDAKAGVNFTYQSRDPEIASVSRGGTVKALQTGSTVITVTSDLNIQTQIPVTVTAG